MITTPVVITVAVILICYFARPRGDQWDGSFVPLVLLAAAVLAATWGIYGAAVLTTGG